MDSLHIQYNQQCPRRCLLLARRALWSQTAKQQIHIALTGGLAMQCQTQRMRGRNTSKPAPKTKSKKKRKTATKKLEIHNNKLHGTTTAVVRGALFHDKVAFVTHESTGPALHHHSLLTPPFPLKLSPAGCPGMALPVTATGA